MTIREDATSLVFTLSKLVMLLTTITFRFMHMRMFRLVALMWEKALGAFVNSVCGFSYGGLLSVIITILRQEENGYRLMGPIYRLITAGLEVEYSITKRWR